MFFKIAVHKNFAITFKKTPVSECLFNKFAGLSSCIFIKKSLQHRCFLKKFLRTAVFIEHLTVHHTFSKFYVKIEFFGRVWVKNWHFSYFLFHCFNFLHGCFHIKIFSGCKFRTHYSLGWETIPELQWLLQVIYCENCEYEFFEYYVLLLFLFRSGLASHGLK